MLKACVQGKLQKPCACINSTLQARMMMSNQLECHVDHALM